MLTLHSPHETQMTYVDLHALIDEPILTHEE